LAVPRAREAYNWGVRPAWTLCIALVAAALCLATPAAADAQSGTLHVGVAALPSTLDPAMALTGPAALVARQVFDTLVAYRDGSGDVEPALAASWSVSRDALVWTFRLRPGVRFHDGTELTATHVARSLERQLLLQPSAPQTASPVALRLLRGAPGVVREIRVNDARTISLVLRQPYAPLLAALAHPGFGIVLTSALEGTAPRWVGTGPFALAEQTSTHLALDAWPGHWRGAPRSARLVLVDPTGAGRLEAETGQGTDLIFPVGAPARVEGAVAVASWRIGYLALQTESEPFKARAVRQAVAAAVGVPAVTAALDPLAVSLRAFLPPSLIPGLERPALPEADPAAARRLLAPRTRGPIRIMLGGALAPLDQGRVAEALRASLVAAGLAATVSPEAPDAAFRIAQRGDHQAVLLEMQADAGDPHFLLYPLSTSEGAQKGPTAWNLSFYRNPRLDELLIRASQLTFRPERLRLYTRAQSALVEDVPWVPLYVRLHWAVARPDLRELRLHPSGFHRLDRLWVEGAPAAAPAAAPRP
jgi:peptide/nickel transport system substrate-binding protein